MNKRYRLFLPMNLFLGLCIGAVNNGAYAQSYTPVPITGFNNDVIAEAGTNAAAVTTTDIDGTLHVLYSNTFATTNSIAGGLPDNGTLVYSNYTWQLAPYTDKNALYISKDPTVVNATLGGVLSLATPAAYSNISVLLFGTEGGSTYSMTLNFADGTSYNPGNFFVYDWYVPLQPVYTLFGRITRITAPPYSPDGINPGGPSAMYKADVLVPCASQNKPLVSITVKYLSGGGLSGRILFMALSGIPYQPPVLTSTITDATCSNSNGGISLTVSGGASPTYTYAWNTTPVQKTPIVTGLAAGTYTCTVTDFNECPTIYKGTVGTVPLAVVTAAATPAAICSGNSTSLTATATGPAVTGYTWSPGAGTGATVSVSPTTTTPYTVTGKDANGCTVSAGVTVTILPTPVATFTSSPDTICQGSTESLTFTGSAGSSAVYDWKGFAGGIVQSGSGAGPYTVLYNTPGNFTLQLQVTDQGCPSAIATRPLVVSGRPDAAFSIDKLPICSGDKVTVSFTGSAATGATASWNWGGGAVQSGKGFGPYTVLYNNGGIIKLTVKNGACTVNAVEQAVAVTPNPLAAFTPQPPGGCVPAQITFTNQSENYQTSLWSFGDGGSSTETSPGHVYTASGAYTVTLIVSNKGQCYDTLTEKDLIQVSTPPVVGFTSNPDTNTEVEIRMADFVFTNQSQNATSYLWKFGDGDSSTQVDPDHKYTAAGNYTVTLYATNGGCTDSLSERYFTVVPNRDLKIPNAFSPNGDGINDNWEIDDLKAYPDCTVTVFNRWGQELFKSIGYQRPWDGLYKGKPVPVATYYYIITLPGKKPYSGWVVLLK